MDIRYSCNQRDVKRYTTEELRDELLKIAFGCWDHMKNHGDHGAENWDLEWIGFLPGKRESRRYVGDYIITQHDVENCPRFEDTVAYGGWQIDNHLPGGFYMDAKGGAHLQKRRLSEPYPIPLRSLYSKNIDNLSRFARAVETTIFVKNAPSYAGIGFGGEGHATFTIAGPTGEGITSAKSFTRQRRCVMADSFRII